MVKTYRMALVLTKAATALKRTAEVEHVKFEAHKPKQRPQPSEHESAKPASKLQTVKSQEADLKKIRHEIVKFGMSGFDAPKKEEARIALAVSLGAKPPKRKNQNYKELMAQRKEEKRNEKERREALGRDMLRSSVAVGKKKKKNVNDVGRLLNVYGKVDKKKIKEREEKITGKGINRKNIGKRRNK